MDANYDKYTRTLCEFAAGLRYEDLPPEVLRRAKQLTLHTMGAALASLPVDQAQNAVAYAQRRGGAAEATVWGSDGRKVPSTDAAFANGTMADVLDWEDCSWTGHPSAGAVPAAFAVCEGLGLTGKDYLLSLTAAYEVYHRIAVAAIPSEDWYKKKAWGLVSWQIFSSAVAAAKAMGQSPRQMAQTMGMAYYMTLANVSKHALGRAKSDVYHYAHGFVARNGINAAEMGELGYGNMYDTLDGPTGFWNIISDQCDWTWLDRDLGKTWYILEVLEKHWPANMWVQVPLEQMARLMEENAFTADEVEKITCTPNIPMLMEPYANTTREVLDAQFSIPYCLTAYMLDHTPGAHWFSPENLRSPEIDRHAHKFEAVGEKVATYQMFRIFRAGSYPEYTLCVYLKDGRILQNKMRYAKGHPQNPYTWEEEQAQFMTFTRGILPEEQAGAIVREVDRLEELPSLEALARLTTLQ